MCRYGYLIRGAFDTACVGEESHDGGGTCFLLDIFELLPLDTEADDGFDERVIAAAIELPFGPMVVGEVIEEAVAFLISSGNIFDAVWGEEEAFGAGVFLRSDARST